MQILKRMNRGVIIFVLLVLGVVIFSIVQHQRDQQLRPEIEQYLNTFYSDADKLIIIDDLRWDINDNIQTDTDYRNQDILITELWENQLAGDWAMNDFLSDNESIRAYSNYWLRIALNTQISSDSRIIQSETTVLGVKSFSVYQGSATIDMSIRWSYEVMYRDGSTESFSSVFDERFTFDREDGRWVLSSYDPNKYYSLYDNYYYYY